MITISGFRKSQTDRQTDIQTDRLRERLSLQVTYHYPMILMLQVHPKIPQEDDIYLA